MPGQGRLGDKGQVPIDTHGCPACPHPAVGPAIVGSPDVMCNKRPALRVGDKGIHAPCCGPNTWTATKGASTVFINGKAAHRMLDEQQHCGGKGMLIEGSTNVIVEEGGGGGGGGAGGGGSGGAGGGGAGGRAGASGGGAGGGGGPGSSTSGGGGSGSGGTTPGSSTPGGGSAGPGAQPGGNQDIPDTPIEPDEIEVRVVSAAGKPVDGARYELTMPDGSVRSGFADATGIIRLTRLTQRGECTIVFPDVDDEARPS
ncbi:MAG: PAAR domain-containing protein [Myxococcales bacterium]|nr:PAAR domain-containing protein [Myxococcales bacterium]